MGRELEKKVEKLEAEVTKIKRMMDGMDANFDELRSRTSILEGRYIDLANKLQKLEDQRLFGI